MKSNGIFLSLLLVASSFLTGGCGSSSDVSSLDSSLDPTFGKDGVVHTEMREYGCGNSVVLDREGRIALAGRADNNFALLVYKPSGELDASFGEGGIVTRDIKGFDDATSVVIDSEDRFVVGGTIDGFSDSDLALVRYDRLGQLDQSFGDGGIVSLDLGGYDSGFSVAIDSRGGILLAGCTSNMVRSSLVVARFLDSGQLDRDFGLDGVAEILPHEYYRGEDMIVDAKGRIVLCGNSQPYSMDGISSNIVLARCDESGKIDSSFGDNGVVTTDIKKADVAYSIVTDGDRLFVSGFFSSGAYLDGPIMSDFLLLSYLESGEIDSSFGEDGVVSVDLGIVDEARSVVVDEDGRIVVVGFTGLGDDPSSLKRDFALLRFKPSGAIDKSFGSDGVIVSDFGGDDKACSAVLDRDGKIVVGGNSVVIDEAKEGREIPFTLARYLSDIENKQ